MVLGGLLGAMAVLALLALLVGRAYRERSLRAHALGIACVVAVVLLARAGQRPAAQAALVLALAASTQNLREMSLHVGSLRAAGPWLSRLAWLVGLLSLPTAWVSPSFALAGLFAWAAAGSLVLGRAWSQSQPWVLWAVAGALALLAAAIATAADGGTSDAMAVPVLFCAWALATYLACVWRSRIFGEQRARRDAEHHYDPLTGLSRMTMVAQRVQMARLLMRRFRHSSTLLLVHMDHLQRIAEAKGPEVAEAAALEAGTRLRDVVTQGDVAARVGAGRFVIFSEGTAAAQAAAAIAAKAIASGLREPLQTLPGNYAQFRVVLCELPPDELALEELIDRLGARIEADASRQRERRIRIVSPQDLGATSPVTTGVSTEGDA